MRSQNFAVRKSIAHSSHGEIFSKYPYQASWQMIGKENLDM